MKLYSSHTVEGAVGMMFALAGKPVSVELAGFAVKGSILLCVMVTSAKRANSFRGKFIQMWQIHSNSSLFNAQVLALCGSQSKSTWMLLSFFSSLSVPCFPVGQRLHSFPWIPIPDSLFMYTSAEGVHVQS